MIKREQRLRDCVIEQAPETGCFVAATSCTGNAEKRTDDGEHVHAINMTGCLA